MRGTSKLVVGEQISIRCDIGRFKGASVTKVLPDGVEMKTTSGPVMFDTNGNACDGSGWKLMLEWLDEYPDCPHDYYDWRCIRCGKEFPN
jgi:hypothetical protein